MELLGEFISDPKNIALAGVAFLALEEFIRRKITERRLREEKIHSNEIAFQILEIQQQLIEAEKNARIDSLTKLANRAAFDEEITRRISHARRQQEPLSVLLIDLDRFKFINDNYGHNEGDIALQIVANSLQTTARGEDIVCRYGGDEFAILLPGATNEEAEEAAKRIHDESHITLRKGRSYNLGGLELNILENLTFSIGIATYDEEENATSLMKRADDQAYVVKRAGRDGYSGGKFRLKDFRVDKL